VAAFPPTRNASPRSVQPEKKPEVVVADMTTGKKTGGHPGIPGSERVNLVVFSPDARTLA